jgi:hypothetical protein
MLLSQRELPSELIELLARSANRLASQFLSVLIRAVDYCPPVDITFGDFLRAIITADGDLVPDDRYAFRQAMIDAFRRRAIFPDHVDSLAEDSLTWSKPRVAVPKIAQLDFANLKFRGDPKTQRAQENSYAKRRPLGMLSASPTFLMNSGLSARMKHVAEAFRPNLLAFNQSVQVAVLARTGK